MTNHAQSFAEEVVSEVTHVLDHGGRVSLSELAALASGDATVSLGERTRSRVTLSRQSLEESVRSGRVIYGVNTSMGGFVNWLVPVSHARALQENLLNAVATNVGRYLDDRTVRAIMLSRIVSLARGNSAITLSNLDKLLAVYNAGVIPCVPEKGSLGTSGDLGPLAAIALVCAGQWRARYDGEELPGAEALARCGIEPMELGFKEGLALVNGTSGMVGLGGLVAYRARQLAQAYILISALSVEALAGKVSPFDPRVHLLKPHLGQRAVANGLWAALADSGLAGREKEVEERLADELRASVVASTEQIEDAYSIRCTPQILGPVVDSIAATCRTIEDELNSSNDNPLIVPEERDVFHNGHFHGQYVAMALDHLVIALATLTNLANRRIDRFLDASNSNGLPPFLCGRDPGLRLGMMGGQFMTASLTAETRTLAVPVSIQSLSTTADFQDIVSFGFVAARRAREVLTNAAYVVAFELMCACQAADLRGAGGLSSATRALYELTRKTVPFLDRDLVMTDLVEAVVSEVLDSDELPALLAPVSDAPIDGNDG